jgi:hypothetical protein
VLDDVLRQQPDGPACVTFWWRGAGQRGQLRLGFAIKDRRNGRCFALLAREDRIKTFRDQLLAHARHHGQIGVERLRDLGVQPARTALGLIRLQQDPRLEDHLRRGFAFGDQLPQPLAFFRAELDHEFLVRHERFALPVAADKRRMGVRRQMQ